HRPSLPVLALFFDPQPNVVVTPRQIVLSEKAISQPLLFCFHLAEQARLRLGQPSVQSVEFRLSGSTGIKKNLLALLHVIRERLLVTPRVGLKLLDQVADHPGVIRHSPFTPKPGTASPPSSEST